MINVVIVSHVSLYREGLCRILAQESDIEVAAQAASVPAAVALLAQRAVDVLLIDLVSATGLDSIRELAARFPGCSLLALGIEEDAQLIADCAEAGIVGYVHRRGSVQDLLEAIRAVVSGELRCSPAIAAGLMRRVASLASSRGKGATTDPKLTRREVEVVGLLDEGLTNKEIAGRLCIATATVRNHVHNILDKLGARTRGEAAAIARRVLTI